MSDAAEMISVASVGDELQCLADVQGSAADIFKLAMIDLDAAIDEAGLAAKMLLTVHDELVLEVPVDERSKTESIVRDVMEHVTELRVPLVVDVGFGPTWAEAT